MPLKRTGLLIRPDNTIIRVEYYEKKEIPDILGIPQDKVKTLLLGKRLCGFSDPASTGPVNDDGTMVLRMTTGSQWTLSISGNMFLCGRANENDLVDCPESVITNIILNGVIDTVYGRSPRFVESMWPDIIVRVMEKYDHYRDAKPNPLRLNVTLLAGKIHEFIGFF